MFRSAAVCRKCSTFFAGPAADAAAQPKRQGPDSSQSPAPAVFSHFTVFPARASRLPLWVSAQSLHFLVSLCAQLSAQISVFPVLLCAQLSAQPGTFPGFALFSAFCFPRFCSVLSFLLSLVLSPFSLCAQLPLFFRFFSVPASHFTVIQNGSSSENLRLRNSGQSFL